MSHDALADSLAHAVAQKYAALPRSGKPRPRSNAAPTWTVLAGFCLYRSDGQQTYCHCISLGTGLKALPHSKLPIRGDVLHDSHAEIIARRGLKLWLYQQIETARAGGRTSFLESAAPKRWRLKGDWKLGLWISTLPCGDASTYSLALSAVDLPPNDLVASTTIPPTCHSALSEAAALGLVTTREPFADTGADTLMRVHRGRNSYSTLSTLRTKPGRADSPPTTSHSCSDKLALWSLLGVQGALLARLGVEVRIDCLAVSGVQGDSTRKEKVREEIRRAVGGRLEGWIGPRDVLVQVPTVGLAEHVDFEHAREAVARDFEVSQNEVVSCQESISWVDSLGVEVITNGIRQGASPKRKPDEPLGPKARSRLSKLSLFQRHVEVERGVSPSNLMEDSTYYASKHNARTSQSGDYQDLKAAVREGPFKGWLVSYGGCFGFLLESTIFGSLHIIINVGAEVGDCATSLPASKPDRADKRLGTGSVKPGCCAAHYVATMWFTRARAHWGYGLLKANTA
ncbi:tRNA-specific adenosine deaminase [Sporobolomyces koalae]|uniref:tRNA-specific adenosine deaminase n=1 Tax=Sporobolomyces koalae TaxID=500713 RepID=UPI00316EF175